EIGGVGDKLAEVSRREGRMRYETKRIAELARKGLSGRVEVKLDSARMPTTESLDDVPRMEGYGIATRAAYDFMKVIADAPSKLPELFEKFPETRAMVDRLASELAVRLTDDELKEDTYFEKDGPAFTFFYPYRLATDPAALRVRLAKSQANDQRRA